MTREELVKERGYQIGTASTKYYHKHPNANPIDAFEAGVDWAEKHPEDPWTDATKQLPPKISEGSPLSVDCIVIASNGCSFSEVIAWYDYVSDSWYEKFDFDQTHLDGYAVLYWMQIPKMPAL